MKSVLFLFLLLLVSAFAYGHASNAGAVADTLVETKNPYKLRPAGIIVPAAVLGIGIWGSGNDWTDVLNRETRDELQENIDRKLTIDDFSQYAPAAAMYALGLCGVKGQHCGVDQTILLGTSAVLMTAATNLMKYSWGIRRPDETTNNSFPSGHTATAFMGAHLLAREYWDVSPWIGVAGYGVATATGFFRIYNNRHWLTDVIAGAGIGVLSVETAYCLYPWVTRHLFPKRARHNVFLAPYYQPQTKGLGLLASIRL